MTFMESKEYLLKYEFNSQMSAVDVDLVVRQFTFFLSKLTANWMSICNRDIDFEHVTKFVSTRNSVPFKAF